MAEENLSEDFKELLSSSNLNEKYREAIRIICKGGTPTPIQVARPGLIDIIKFFIETYQCTRDEEFSDVTSDLEEKPFSCSECDKRFKSEDDLEQYPNHLAFICRSICKRLWESMKEHTIITDRLNGTSFY